MNNLLPFLDKKCIQLLVVFIALNLNLHAQTLFEKGFFIRNNNEKVACKIKNEDWLDNPTSITYQLEENSTIKKISIDEILSFEILNQSKYIKRTVEVNASEKSINELSNKRMYHFDKQTILLKVLIEGDISLYQYTHSNFTNFYISKKGQEEIELLVYREYISDEKYVKQDYHFRQQLLNKMNDSTISIENFKKLEYYKKELVNLVKKYNELKGGEYIKTEKSGKQRKKFNFYIRPGISSSSLNVIDDAFATTDNISIGHQLTFRTGIEAEYILPFNNNKWGLILEPAFQYYTMEKEIDSRQYDRVLAQYKSIELGMGIRHYSFLNKTTKMYINGLFVYDNDINSTITYAGRRKFEILSYYNAALGLGLSYKNKFSLELRYYTKRDLLKSYLYFRTEYQTFSLIAAIKL